MSNYNPGTWEYFRNAEETFSVFSAECLDDGYTHKVIVRFSQTELLTLKQTQCS